MIRGGWRIAKLQICEHVIAKSNLLDVTRAVDFWYYTLYCTRYGTSSTEWMFDKWSSRMSRFERNTYCTVYVNYTYSVIQHKYCTVNKNCASFFVSLHVLCSMFYQSLASRKDHYENHLWNAAEISTWLGGKLPSFPDNITPIWGRKTHVFCYDPSCLTINMLRQQHCQ
jgi:hypothetical protein